MINVFCIATYIYSVVTDDAYFSTTVIFHSYHCMDSTETIGIADDIQGIYQTGHGLSKG